MSGELIERNDSDLVAEIEAMPTAQLREELAKGLRLTAYSLLRLAVIVKTLEERGESLNALKIGLLHHLRRIACGQIIPETVVRFAGAPSLIAIIGNLPLPDQRRLADGESVRLLVYAPDGATTVRMADPLEMTQEQIRQVFARDHIREDPEQALILDQRRSKANVRLPEKIGQLRIDKEKGGVWHKREFIPQAELAAALAALRK